MFFRNGIIDAQFNPSNPWTPAGFFRGVGKFIGVARIFSGRCTFSTFFSRRPQNRPKLGVLAKNYENNA